MSFVSMLLSESTLGSARQGQAAREFVTSGGVGYALFTARNPRDIAS
jgi:hypothetical protein